MGEAPVAIKIDHGLLRELRGITVYVKGRTLVPLDFATAHIDGTNRVSMTRINFWRVTEIDAECVFPSGGINCIADAKVCALFIRSDPTRVSGQPRAMLGWLRIENGRASYRERVCQCL